ncbi:MAG: hypothetical protein ACRD0G_03815 [Acidimicrobiales bacterium]
MSEHRNRLAALVAVAGAALAAGGTFLTWYEIEIAGFAAPGGDISGWEGRDGRTVVFSAAVAGLVAAMFAMGQRRLVWKIVLLAAGGVTTIVAFAGITDARTKSDKIEDEFRIPPERVAADVGIGLWIVAAGGVAELAAGAIARHEGSLAPST